MGQRPQAIWGGGMFNIKTRFPMVFLSNLVSNPEFFPPSARFLINKYKTTGKISPLRTQSIYYSDREEYRGSYKSVCLIGVLLISKENVILFRAKREENCGNYKGKLMGFDKRRRRKILGYYTRSL